MLSLYQPTTNQVYFMYIYTSLIWNKRSENCKHAEILNSFKSRLKPHLLGTAFVLQLEHRALFSVFQLFIGFLYFVTAMESPLFVVLFFYPYKALSNALLLKCASQMNFPCHALVKLIGFQRQIVLLNHGLRSDLFHTFNVSLLY